MNLCKVDSPEKKLQDDMNEQEAPKLTTRILYSNNANQNTKNMIRHRTWVLQVDQSTATEPLEQKDDLAGYVLALRC